jgi:hypothetical protein
VPVTPTPDELRNGWTAEAIEAYRAERDACTERVAGNTVTEFKRPDPPVRIESALAGFRPHRWMK